VQHFWRAGAGLVGFREFPEQPGDSMDWLMEVDAGPVIAGFGTAANAFGVGAARAYSLTALALLAAWPLPDGTLLGPRVVSNLSDAPYIAQAALLFSLAQPAPKQTHVAQSSAPPAFWLIGLILLVATLLLLRVLTRYELCELGKGAHGYIGRVRARLIRRSSSITTETQKGAYAPFVLQHWPTRLLLQFQNKGLPYCGTTFAACGPLVP